MELINAELFQIKNQTIGIEVERNNITKNKAAKIAATHFRIGKFENTASKNSYNTWSVWDEQGRKWKFQKDSRIKGIYNEKCELVPKILIYKDVKNLQGLIRNLRYNPRRIVGEMLMKDNNKLIIKNCPKCGKVYPDISTLSRVDNITYICKDCGTREALDSIGIDKKEQEKILEIIHQYTRVYKVE
jgi:predicted RNA-binding Zn-ribbon protein involved in translation (DUF1610 family)